jgi:hypothetical protein
VPDFLARLRWEGQEVGTLILEVKGYRDEESAIKEAAARRWLHAVNNDGQQGRWDYRIIYLPTDLNGAVRAAAERLEQMSSVALG